MVRWARCSRWVAAIAFAVLGAVGGCAADERAVDDAADSAAEDSAAEDSAAEDSAADEVAERDSDGLGDADDGAHDELIADADTVEDTLSEIDALPDLATDSEEDLASEVAPTDVSDIDAIDLCGPAVRCVHPPEVADPFAPCRAGAATFDIALGGTCGGTRCEPAIGCVYPTVAVACPPPETLAEPPASGRLFQRQPYQVVIRNWLATLGADDFAVTIADQDPDSEGLQAFAYDPDYFSGPDALERLFAFYVITDGRGNGMPGVNGLRLDAAGFTLSGIENADADGNGYVRMRIGRGGNGGTFEPSHTVWWALWDYPKNPIHQGSNLRAALLRAFVGAAVDLVMRDGYLDDVPLDGPVGGWSAQAIYNPLAHYGYAYWAFKRELDQNGAVPHAPPIGIEPAAPLRFDPCVAAAFEIGLRRWVRRIDAQPMVTAAGNNDIPQHVHFGLHFAAEALEDPEFTNEAVRISRAVLAPPYRSPTGYVTHSPANEVSWSYDPSYEGITLHHLSGAVLASRDAPAWSFLADMTREEIALKAHQTLVEPDGAQVSPNHYANATSSGVTHDQWSHANRDYALAMIADDAHYLVFRPRARDGGYREYRVGLPDAATLDYEARITSFWLGAAAGSPGLVAWPQLATPLAWPEDGWGAVSWSEGLTGAFFPPPDAYARLVAAQATNDPLNVTPFERAPFERAFGDEFVVIKRAGGAAAKPFGVILHTGQVTRQWGGSDPNEVVTGLGGGELSTFWTPDAGAAWLGWTHGFQDSTWGQELWADWRSWTAHVITGATATGAFTSGRIAIPVVARSTADDGALVVSVSGVIDPNDPQSFSQQTGALVAPVDYQRVFRVDDGGVDIETRLTAAGADTVQELSESLPLFVADEWYQNVAEVAPTLELTTASGETIVLDVTTADDTPLNDIVALRYRRFTGAIDVTLDRPRTVQLGHYLVGTGYQWGALGRAVRIDLLDDGPAPLVDVSVRYRVSPGVP